jgi:hypothetical protein
MINRIFWLLSLMLILAACSADEPVATVPATEVATEIETQPTQIPTEVIATDTEETASIPAEPTPVPDPATPTAIPTATPPGEPAIGATVEVETPPTVEIIINGHYENTYFRGSETAPVTLIDYSDFL